MNFPAKAQDFLVEMAFLRAVHQEIKLNRMVHSPVQAHQQHFDATHIHVGNNLQDCE